jgi:HAD superfamily hydrolase (TIGR01509 family)
VKKRGQTPFPPFAVVDAVILDMDGLMLDTEPIYRTAWQRASRELGFELDDVTYEAWIGRPTGDCEKELLQHFGPSFPLNRFNTRWPELWKLQAEAEGIERKPGLDDLLAFLDSRGIPRAVATSSDADYTDFTLRRAGLSGRFDIIVTSDQVAHGKPAPDLYLEAARRLQQDPAHCLALEDSDAGVLAATTAGMTTLCIPDLKPPSEGTKQAAFRVLPSLHEVRSLLAELTVAI